MQKRRNYIMSFMSLKLHSRTMFILFTVFILVRIIFLHVKMQNDGGKRIYKTMELNLVNFKIFHFYVFFDGEDAY